MKLWISSLAEWNLCRDETKMTTENKERNGESFLGLRYLCAVLPIAKMQTTLFFFLFIDLEIVGC